MFGLDHISGIFGNHEGAETNHFHHIDIAAPSIQDAAREDSGLFGRWVHCHSHSKSVKVKLNAKLLINANDLTESCKTLIPIIEDLSNS